MAFILEALVVRDRSLSKLVSSLPSFHLRKCEIACPPERMHVIVNRYRRRVASDFRGEEYRLDYSDGVRLVFEEAWVHLRASATASLLRVYAEARTKKRADWLTGLVAGRIEKWLS